MCQGIDPDVLDWDALLSCRAEFTASLGLAEVDPVGGAVTGAPETGFLDKGLQQYRSYAVSFIPVGRERFGDLSEYHGGEVLSVHPRQNEEAGVVDDVAQVLLPSG